MRLMRFNATNRQHPQSLSKWGNKGKKVCASVFRTRLKKYSNFVLDIIKLCYIWCLPSFLFHRVDTLVFNFILNRRPHWTSYACKRLNAPSQKLSSDWPASESLQTQSNNSYLLIPRSFLKRTVSDLNSVNVWFLKSVLACFEPESNSEYNLFYIWTSDPVKTSKYSK